HDAHTCGATRDRGAPDVPAIPRSGLAQVEDREARYPTESVVAGGSGEPYSISGSVGPSVVHTILAVGVHNPRYGHDGPIPSRTGLERSSVDRPREAIGRLCVVNRPSTRKTSFKPHVVGRAFP